MSPTQIAPFLVLAGISCIVQLTFAQSATPDSTLENDAEGWRMGENAVGYEEAPILAVLQEVEAAFSEKDLPRYLSLFHSPYVIMSPAGVIAPSSDDEALTLLRPQMENLRARGYARSELNRATVKLLSATTALATVEWVRFKANNEALERLGATYAFFKGDRGWKIVMVTVYPPVRLAEQK
jgi:hypothetical protein